MVTEIKLYRNNSLQVEPLIEAGELPMIGVRVYADLTALGLFLAPHEALQMAAALAKAAGECQAAQPTPAHVM